MSASQCIILPGPWTERVKSPEDSFRSLISLLDQHLSALKTARLDLADKCQWFDIRRYVLPIECAKMVVALEMLEHSAGYIRDVLSDVSGLPVVFLSSRYYLLSPLYDVDEQIQAVIPAIQSFRFNCFESSRKTLREQQLIHNQLIQLVQLCHESERQGRALLDQVSLQVA